MGKTLNCQFINNWNFIEDKKLSLNVLCTALKR